MMSKPNDAEAHFSPNRLVSEVKNWNNKFNSIEAEMIPKQIKRDSWNFKAKATIKMAVSCPKIATQRMVISVRAFTAPIGTFVLLG